MTLTALSTTHADGCRCIAAKEVAHCNLTLRVKTTPEPAPEREHRQHHRNMGTGWPESVVYPAHHRSPRLL